MSVRISRLRYRYSRLKNTLADPESGDSSVSSNRLFGRVLAFTTKKTKKAALRLVQSTINSFIISITSQKSRRKNEQKTSKNGPKSPSNGDFLPENRPPAASPKLAVRRSVSQEHGTDPVPLAPQTPPTSLTPLTPLTRALTSSPLNDKIKEFGDAPSCWVRGMMPGSPLESACVRPASRCSFQFCIRPIEHTIRVCVLGSMALEDLLCTQSFAPEASSIASRPATF